MLEMAREYPQYQFDHHKGYGTKLHYELLRRVWPQSHPPPDLFEKPMSGQESRLLGRWGEALAAEYLRRKGCRILAANWRCRLGRVDLIARDRDYLCFVEVKLRQERRYGRAAEPLWTGASRRSCG